MIPKCPECKTSMTRASRERIHAFTHGHLEFCADSHWYYCKPCEELYAPPSKTNPNQAEISEE